MTLQFGFPGGIDVVLCPPPGATVNFQSRKITLALNWFKFEGLNVNKEQPFPQQVGTHLCRVLHKDHAMRSRSAGLVSHNPLIYNGKINNPAVTALSRDLMSDKGAGRRDYVHFIYR
jgi:hypothetical protein